MLAASIDIGTNSSRLLIVDYKSKEDYNIVQRELITTRLGEGVDKNKKLNSRAMTRVIAAIEEFNEKINNAGVKKENVLITGTSALRDVKNSDTLKHKIKSETGFNMKVITGQKEAHLIYKGVSMDLAHENNFLLIDIGGGSTELIWKEKDEINYISINMGAVRMTERYITDPAVPLHKFELKQIKNEVNQLLQARISDQIPIKQVVGVGGTITTLAAMDLKLEKYDHEKVHCHQITTAKIRQIFDKVAGINLKQRKKLTGLRAERADIIISGVIILIVIMEYFNLNNLTVSEHDILFGLIREIAE